jgi:hypothetical protein
VATGVLKAAREASPEDMEERMRDDAAPWLARLKAIEIMLDRGWGTDPKSNLDRDSVGSITSHIERHEPPLEPEPVIEHEQQIENPAHHEASALVAANTAESPNAPGISSQRLPTPTVVPVPAPRQDAPVVRNNGKVPSFRARHAAGIWPR